MATQIPRDSEIMSWDPENMETYWQQCRNFDTRPIMSIRQSQDVSQAAFSNMLKRFAKERRSKSGM
jgi:hypothetical protein